MVLDVFGQHQANYLFCCEHLESVLGGDDSGALDHNETFAHVLERYNGLWIEVSWSRWSGVAGIHRLRLGKKCSRQEENLGIINDYLV
jgi:hypothetical protein